MPTTVQSSIGSSVATSTENPAGETDASSYTSDTTLVFVNSAGASGDGGLGANILADGAAFGTDTYTSAQIVGSVVDGAYADSVSAVVQVTSAAQSDADAVAFATAVAELIGDADVMIGITHNVTVTTTDGETQSSTAVSFASITALQFDTDGTGSVASEPPDCGCDGAPAEEAPSDTTVVLAGEDGVLNSPDLDGNLSVFDIAADAFGDNTLVDVQVDATALEDQFSGVTAAVFIVID
jgi:hypothetical protein